MEATSRSLEITVLSAENLRLDGKRVKKNSFVVAKVDQHNHWWSTKADCDGGSSPSWNEKLNIDMPMYARVVTLEVKCRTGSKDQIIGTACLPVSDLLGDYAPASYLHFLSYRLRDPNGGRNGIINVSARMKSAAPPVPVPDCEYSATRKNWMEYGLSSASKPQMGVPVGQKGYYSGIVTGVPVWG